VNRFLLDTNVLSEFSRVGTPDPRVKSWMKSYPTESFYASILTLAEILRGTELLPIGKRRRDLERWLYDDLPRSLGSQGMLPVTRTIGSR
jgi:predicted nucleic acid-binding protein